MRERLKELLVEYGKVALVIYLVLFVISMVGFAIAIGAGYEPEGVAGNAGLIGAAWVATKLAQPLRILATVALTPLVARFVLRRPPSPPPAPAPAAPPASPPPEAEG